MAITVNLGGVDVTAYVDIFSINLDESASGGFVGNCRLTLHDTAASLTVEVKAALSIVDGAVALFTGTVVDRRGTQDGLGILWEVTAQDLNVLLDEVTIESESYLAGQSDAAVIDDLFTTYLATVDSTTYVEEIDAVMEALSWQGMTLREIMDDICKRTGGRYYVDYDSRLHYFTTESNDAAFALSTEPDMAASFPYGGFEFVDDGGRIINKVFVLGNGVSGWGQDNDSIAEYGELSIPSRDMRITTAQGVTDRINAILAEYADGRATYTLHTEQDGLRAGMRVNVINSVFGIDTWLYIRRLTLEFLSADGERRQYNLTLGAEPPDPVANRRSVEVRVGSVEEIINNIVPGAFDTTPPNTPALVSGNVTSGVDLADDGSQLVYLLVTWGAVGDSDLAYYDVQVSAAADFSGYTLTRPHPGDGDRVEKFFPLVGGTAYYVRVRAVDVSGNVGSWSDVVEHEAATDTSAPAQVAGLVVAGARTLIGLTWNANSEADLANYEVQRAPDSGGSPGAFATVATTKTTFYVDDTHSEADIAAAKVYWYRVRAIDSSGNAGDYSTAAGAALSQVGSDTLAAGCIITAKIAAGQVTAEKISVVQLSAISANLGTITAGTVTGATLRTAASGARCQMDSTNGYQAYNASGAQTFSVQTTGAGYIGASDKIAWNTAGSVSVDGSVLVAGSVVATAFSNTIALPLFTAADGLALWGPGCEISPTAWTSTRGQVATISGAFHQVQGRWTGTRALVVEQITTNYVPNPSAGITYVGWSFDATTTKAPYRTTDAGTYLFDGAGFVLTSNGGGTGPYMYIGTVPDLTPVQGETWFFSCWVKGTAETVGKSFRILIREDGGAQAYQETVTLCTITADWQRVWVSHTVQQSDRTRFLILARMYYVSDGAQVYVDGYQFEEGQLSSTAIGSMDWCSWDGAEHNSKSLRYTTSVNLNDHVNLMNGRTAWTMRLVAQMPHDNDSIAWQSPLYNWLIGVRLNNLNTITLYYNPTNRKFYFQHGSVNTVAASDLQSFSAGDWLDIVLTADFIAGDYRIYIDGALSGTSTYGAATPPNGMTAWRVGGSYADTQLAGCTIAEYGVLGSVLTAEDVAAMHNLGKPLVDTGAVDVPGVYIYDGKFLVANRATGIRQVLAPTYLSIGSDPTFSSGTGIWLGLDGETPKFRIGTTAGNRISWDGSTLTVVGSITITGGSGIANLTDAGACATADTIDEVPEGDTYGRVRQTDLSGGHLKLSSYTVIDGEWYDQSGVEIDANTGINIYGKKNALTTRATKTGTIQCYVGADGAIYAGGGGIKMSSAANLLFSTGSQTRGIAWFSDSDFSTVSGYINVATSTGVMTIATGGPSWGTAPDMRFDLLSSAGGGTTWTAIYIDASDKEVRVNGGSGATLSVRNNGDGDWAALYAQQVSNDRAVAHFDQDHATAPILRLDGPWDAATEKTLGGYFKVNVNGTNRWVPYYV